MDNSQDESENDQQELDEFAMENSQDESESDEQEQFLGMKPLQSLAPMFPLPMGYDVATQSTDPMLVFVTPFRPCTSPEQSPASFGQPLPKSPIPLKATPISAAFPMPRHKGGSSHDPLKDTPMSVAFPMPRHKDEPSDDPLKAIPISAAFPMPRHKGETSDDPLKATPVSAAFRMPRHKDKSSDDPLKATPMSRSFPIPRHEDESSDEDYKPFSGQKKTTPLKTAKRTQQAECSNAANTKRRSIQRSLNKELAFSSSMSSDPKESVEEAMIMFDSLRRRILQLDEKEDAGKRADLKAGSLMMQNGLRINSSKIIGPVPGVEIGDIFFFRIEMCIVGLHAPAMAGIDYISAKHAGKDEILAVSIISSGGYENDDNDMNILVYTGQGGNSRHKDKHDQKLERGNLALMNSMKKKNLIRVVRSAQDPFCNSSKIYIYDGLYWVEDSWTDRAKNGFSVFKYKLRREPGQLDGISVWKKTEKWKANPVTRNNVIRVDISSKAEKLPVCLVSDVDDQKGPSYFNYITGVEYSRPLSKTKPLQSCKCPSVCLPSDTNCSCAQLNSGYLPYSANGVLVKHIPMLYECSSTCQCCQNCRNRVTQKGVNLNFEVFWTGDCGWGVRSWDPIRAGTFICEYAGQVIDETNMNMGDEEDEYTFRTSWHSDKVSRWNLGAELLEEKSDNTTTENLKKLPIVISAKRSGNVARFLNHSCSPNLLWQPVQYDHGDDSYPHIMFFAMKHIPPMAELTYDYGARGDPPGIKGKFPNVCKLKPCFCGSTNCRGSF
ncbi:histone-lysine N-methyltransferase, H3 lysine-9 specific SUVH3-like isoform X2 [Miscanthus floridulus]|uniref:histone-lysine N-methyltransferase, H3 lysine-9 specific SUVH3-like isoform X2 n=1 Tax=Miscanthus floridulus TaxID=154761 RepID=UPI00345A0FFC